MIDETTRDFLTRVLPITTIASHADMAKTCLTLLSFPSSPNGGDLGQYPLLSYAATFWGNHVVACGLEENEEVIAFLWQPLNVKHSLKWVDSTVWLPTHQEEARQGVVGWSGLHVAIYFDFLFASQILSQQGIHSMQISCNLIQ